MKKYWAEWMIFTVTILAFIPVFFGRVPLNTRNLVSFFTPWYYEKFPGFPAGVPGKPGMLDQIRLYYPYMALTQWAYRHGQLPLWNPYNFSGNPHMAEWQSGAFYPLHILLPFFPLPVYWSFFQIVSFTLAGLFTFVFLRNLKLKKIPSLIGAVAFMLSSFMTTWNMEVITAPHSILWLPLILFTVDKVVTGEQKTKNRKIKWWIVGLLSLVFSILAGYWQTTLYVMMVSCIYILYRLSQKRTLFTAYSLLLLAWFPLALSLTAYHLLPTWELFQRSSRPSVNGSDRLQNILLGYLLPMRQSITLFAPDYFGHPTTRNYFAHVGGGTYYEHALFVGTIPFFLGAVAIVCARKRYRDIVFWFIITVFFASFSFKTPWAKFVYYWKFPVLSTGIANRVLFVPAFALSVLAAFGMDYIERDRPKKQIINMGILFASGIFLLAATTFLLKTSFGAIGPNDDPHLYLTSLKNMVIPSVVFGAGICFLLLGIKEKKSYLGFLFVLILVIAQNLYQHYKFTAFSESQFTYPSDSPIKWLQDHEGIDRFLGYNGQFLENDFATYLKLYTIEGYDSLNDAVRSTFIQSSVNGKFDTNLPTSADVSIGRDLKNDRIIKLMKLFGIRYIVDHPEWIDVGDARGKPRLPNEAQRLVFQEGDWKIWEYLDAFPRAFLSGNYEVIADPQRNIDRLYSSEFNPRETLLLSKQVPQSFHITPDARATVDITSYTPTNIKFHTISQTDQLLFLSDTWYPGWHATLETGQKLPIFTAFTALRAVPIPAGDHIMTMWYFPDSFRNGFVIAVAAAAFIVFGFVYNLRHA